MKILYVFTTISQVWDLITKTPSIFYQLYITHIPVNSIKIIGLVYDIKVKIEREDMEKSQNIITISLGNQTTIKPAVLLTVYYCSNKPSFIHNLWQ